MSAEILVLKINNLENVCCDMEWGYTASNSLYDGTWWSGGFKPLKNIRVNSTS